MVQRSWLGVQGVGFRIPDLGFQVWGVEFRVQMLRFGLRADGFELRV